MNSVEKHAVDSLWENAFPSISSLPAKETTDSYRAGAPGYPPSAVMSAPVAAVATTTSQAGSLAMASSQNAASTRAKS